MFEGAQKFFRDAGDNIASGFDVAQNWLDERAQDAREYVSDTYDNMVSQATDLLLEHTPEPLREGAAAIAAGSGKIGKQVVEFLDPVSYGLEVTSDVLQTATKSPREAWESMKMIAHGEVGDGLARWGRTLGNTYLTEAEVLATVLPTGYLAGKAAKVPIKAARKELKVAKKAAPKGSVERKAIKHDLHQNSVKKHVAKRTAIESAQLAEKLGADRVADAKRNLNPREKFQAPKRDWSKLGLQEPASYYEFPLKNRRR